MLHNQEHEYIRVSKAIREAGVVRERRGGAVRREPGAVVEAPFGGQDSFARAVGHAGTALESCRIESVVSGGRS